MALELEYEVVWLAEFTLPSPSGTLRFATQDNVVDEAGARYTRGLLTPSIRREMSSPTYGVPAVPQIVLELAAVEAAEPTTPTGAPGANAVVDAFFDVEPRGAAVKIRRLNKRTNAISTRIVGVINRVSVGGDRLRVEVGDSRLDVFESLYPRVLVDTDTFPGATSESFALQAPVPLHFGAHREHAPALYVSGEDRTYTAQQLTPKLYGHHRYVVGHTMAKAASGGYANVTPRVASLYRGVAIGSALVNAGEYLERTNWPMTVVGGLTAVLVAGGDLSLTLHVYEITAWNGICETNATATVAATPTAGNQTIRVGWSVVPGAIGYRIRRDTFLIACLGGGDVTSFDDTGSAYWIADPTVPIPTSGNGLIEFGRNTLEVIFPQAQRSADDQLASILADVETELGWDPDVRGLWHFRDSGIRDSKVTGYQNYLTRPTTIAFWGFFTAVDFTQSLTGNNTLTVTPPGGLKKTDVVDGPYKPVVQFPGGSAYFFLSNALSTGLNRSTLSTRYDFHARADEGTTNKTGMWIYYKTASTTVGPGIMIGISNGVLTVMVADGVDAVTVRGQTVWDGAWHRGAVIIDRSLNELRIEVDGALDAAPVSLSAIGSIDSTTGNIIGAGFYGQLDWLSVDSNILPLAVLVPGRSGLGNSAIDFNDANQSVLSIRDASQQGLDFGTGAFEVEIWFKLAAVPAPGTYVTLLFKGAPGYWCEVQNTGGVVTFRGWVQGGTIGATKINSTNTVSANRWHYATLVVPASKQAYVTLDTVKSSTVNVTGLNVDSTGDFIVGAQNTGGFAKFTGAIDEIRITARERTDAERAEAYYLGKRNLVAQARQLLESAQHGPGLTLNNAEWVTAAQAIDALQVLSPHVPGTFCTDLALVEQRPLKEQLGELFKLRGVQVRFASDGTLGVLVDTQRSAVAKYGHFDDTWRNVLDRPERSQSLVSDAVKQIRVQYRRKRRGAGEVDRFTMKSALKSVLSVGSSDPRMIECAALRDPPTAEVVNKYFGERMILADQQVTFETADESALLVSPGDLVTLDDPISGRAVQTLEVLSLTERGQRFGFECVAWSSAIYSFVLVTPPTPPATENEPDYSATLPPPVAGIAVSFGAVIQNDGRRAWQALVTWTKPAGFNVASIVVEWKPIASLYWRPGMIVRGTETAAVLDDLFDDSSSYDFRIYALNKFQLAGPVGSTGQLTGVTTQPDAPTNPDTASSPGSWTINLTGTGTTTRTRRWRFDKHPARNIDYYEWEVYTAASGGTLMGSGRTGGSNILYQESGLGRTTQRFCQVRAVNKSGLASLYSSRIVGSSADQVTGGSGGDLGHNGTVATGDAAANAFTDASATPGTVNGTALTGSFVTYLSTVVAADSGVVVVWVTGTLYCSAAVSAIPTVTQRLLINGSATGLGAEQRVIAGGSFLTGGQTGYFNFSFHYVDSAPGTGSRTYAFQLLKSGGSDVWNVYGRINAVEYKR